MPTPDATRAWRALMLAHAKVTNEIDRVLRCEVGIPASWYEALVEIALAGGTMTMTRFAEETTLTKSGATRFVDRLETAGLVTRTASKNDRRRWELSLTPEGKRLQRRADPHVLGVIDRLFASRLEDRETNVVGEALGRVAAAPLAGLVAKDYG